MGKGRFGKHGKFSKNFGGKSRNFPRRPEKNGLPSRQHRGGQHNKDHIVRSNLSEDQVGITEYVSQGPGFQGIIKARFSDFHVNEIDLEGHQVQLSNQDVPEPIDDGPDVVKLASLKEELEAVITPEILEKIQEILKDKNQGEEKLEVNIDVTALDKDKRTLVHKTLKEQYGSKIITTTITVGEGKFIQCRKVKSGENQRTKWLWPGEYVYFVMHKENTDTVQAASDLAQFLRLQPSMVHYAGTKDKRAKTSQTFCVKKREPTQIFRAANRFPYMKVGNFEFKDKVLKLGELKGNRFRIALRHIRQDDETISESLESLKEYGFINYFGLQRFGNCASIPTYKIGVALLKGDYKEACELILKPRENDSYVLREARERWWKNRNSAEASSLIHNNKFIEKKLLDGLARFGENDYANSLRRLPRNMLLLYTHSYQSFIWNKVASRRIKDFGLKVIPGDLVYKDDEGKEPSSVLDVVDIESLIESSEEESPEDNGEADFQFQEQISLFKAKVQPLTEEDIESGKYTIFDIVLPLPGHDITYPANEVQDWYKQLLEEDGLSSEKLKNNVKTYSLAGAYRKILIKPENMKWEIKRYTSQTSTLLLSDYEIFKGIKADEDGSEGTFKALLLDFALPASSYATMALREVLKSDTSASNQTKLNEEECKRLEHENEIHSDSKAEATQNDNINAESDDNILQSGDKRKCSDESETEEQKKQKVDE